MRDIPNKTPGSFYFAAECTDMFSEEKNIITDTGIVLSASDLYQISKAVANYAGGGDFYTDTGGLNAYVLSPIGLKQGPTSYAIGLRARFFPNSTNTSSIVTVNLHSLGTKNIVRGNGIALDVGEMHTNLVNEIVYDGINFRLVSSNSVGHADPLTPKFRDCILSNNTTDPNKDIDFGPGYFRAKDATGAERTFHNISTITKQADVPWAQGSGLGGMAGATLSADTWYHEFYIAKDDGTVDAGFDVSRTAVNLLATGSGLGYKYYSRRSSFYSNASNNIYPFIHKENTFWTNGVPIEETTVPGISYVPITILTPRDVITEAHCRYLVGYIVQTPGAETYIRFKSLVVPFFETIALSSRMTSNIFEPIDVERFTILSDTNSQIEVKKQVNAPAVAIQSAELVVISYTELYNQ